MEPRNPTENVELNRNMHDEMRNSQDKFLSLFFSPSYFLSNIRKMDHMLFFSLDQSPGAAAWQTLKCYSSFQKITLYFTYTFFL